jgi:hypothetical protein
MTKVMRKHGTAIRVEDLQASDGSLVTKEDETFFNWAAGHVVVEWNDHSLHAEGIH